MIKEVTNSIKAALYQRISSPLYGTYIFSWAIYNWELVLQLLFGTNKFDQRLAIFKTGLIPEDGSFNYNTIIVPFIITALILIIQPLLQRFIFIYTEWNKSEGLKKRDEYASETSLTLEQSNELRSSVQKVQQFHQEVLKNKEEEINEYKKQAESKDKALNTVNENNLALIEKNALLENDKSELSSQLAKLNSDILVNNDNYTRLSKLLSKARKSKSEFIKLSQVNGWFINETIKRQLPKVIYIDNDFRVAQNASIFVEMLNASNDDAWVTGCHELMIHGFSKCWSFDMADSYFSEIIKPNLQNFSADHLRDLSTVMRANGQIRDRNRAEADMKLVTAALSSKVA